MTIDDCIGYTFTCAVANQARLRCHRQVCLSILVPNIVHCTLIVYMCTSRTVHNSEQKVSKRWLSTRDSDNSWISNRYGTIAYNILTIRWSTSWFAKTVVDSQVVKYSNSLFKRSLPKSVVKVLYSSLNASVTCCWFPKIKKKLSMYGYLPPEKQMRLHSGALRHDHCTKTFIQHITSC